MRRAVVLLVSSIGILTLGCDKFFPQQEKKGPPPPPPPVPIAVGRVQRSNVDVTVSGIGWVEPYSTVTIKAQVAGELVSVQFKEGDDVKRDQILFTIDARPFEAALHLAEANLKRDQALAQDARREANRIAGLFANGQSSPRERDVTEADAQAKEAQVRADEAERESARLQVEYCTIRSPIDGRAGTILAHAGNIAKERDTPLVTLNQIAPVYVAFSVAERYLAGIRAAQVALPVSVNIGGDESSPITGTLAFIDNEVDRNTGMIGLKAVFENADRRLWPGQFVDARLILQRLSNVVTAPASAIQAGQQRTFVFVVDADRIVADRTVETGMSTGGRTVITSGLQGDEVVVTDGQLRLTPGARVTFSEEPAATSQGVQKTEVAGR